MDPISNMLTQLKNASQARKKQVKVNFSKLNLAVLANLKSRGFINDYEPEKNEDKKYPASINVRLKYKNQNEPYLVDIRRVSRPGKRVYVRSKEINKTIRGRIEIFISTPQGIMTGSDARKKGLGGEVICEVR